MKGTVAYLRRRGCAFACAFEQHLIDSSVLQAMGFRPSGDRVHLSFGGAPAAVRKVRDQGSRLNIDFL